MPNPLLNDRDVSFLLYEVLDAEGLLRLPAFREHSRETFDMFLEASRGLARDLLLPAYKPMDENAPHLADGHVHVHAKMREIYPQLVELGVITATRPSEVGGSELPFTVASLAYAYLMAANLGAFGYAGLTVGAGRLIENYGSETLKATYMSRMYEGTWTGTMALTEPQAGSSLADLETKAKPTSEGHYLIEGAKIFISGGDQDLTENIVHLTLARIEGAPPGVKGLSLFVVPKKRPENGALVPNDVTCTGVFHKIGWKGLPSVALSFGDNGDCRGWLVGEPHQGIRYMFQMMNEARLSVGLNGVATAAAAYHQALEYARERPQGRPVTEKNPESPQIPIVRHADVKRMLLRMKAIVEGGLSLTALCAKLTDLSEHAESPAEKDRAKLLLDLLTPIAKTFPAEKGFEANVLAVQVHGGYGYTTEYLPEAWMRDQKLNSLHEGTTGIQSLDLLGRKVVMSGGAALQALGEEVARAVGRAREAGVDAPLADAVEQAMGRIGALTMTLGMRGAKGDVEGMLLHSADYLELFSTFVIAWQWLLHATAAKKGLDAGASGGDAEFYQGKLAAAQYWIRTELPKIEHLARLCEEAEDSYAKMQDAWF